MKKYTMAALLGLLLSAMTASAQVKWHKGEVSLVTGFRLTGDLCYQFSTNTLLFRQGDKWRMYQIDEILRFRHADPTTNLFHTFAPYEILHPNGKTQLILFEELLPGVDVQLLELPPQYTWQQVAKYHLPSTRTAHWQTPNPRFVWLYGRPVAPDTFVRTELDNLIATSVKTARQWADTTAQPADPNSLGRWLSTFHNRISQGSLQNRPASNTVVISRNIP